MPPRILSFAMQKGGVGKTTVSTNLAGAFAGHHGLRVLVVDFDSQCNTTRSLLGTAQEGPNVWDVLRHEVPMADVMRPTPYCDRLFVVPGSRELPVWDKRISSAEWDRFVLAAHESLPRLAPEDVDLVIFDTPPSLGLWMQCALAASDSVLIVAKPDVFSRDGLEEIQETISAIRRSVNRRLAVEGIVLNQVRENTVEHSGYLDAYREVFGAGALEPHIPDRIVAAELQRLGHPIEFHKDNSERPRDFRERFRDLAGRLLENWRAGRAAGAGDVEAEPLTKTA